MYLLTAITSHLCCILCGLASVILLYDWQEQAVSTFNFLSDEKRYVAGALIPPTTVILAEDEVFVKEKWEGDETTAERDMLRVMDRMAKLKGEQFNKLPEDSSERKDQWPFNAMLTYINL